MTKEKGKYNFFNSLKKTILKTNKEADINKEISPEEDLFREITLTTVSPEEKVEEIVSYQNISKSEYLDEQFAENFVSSNGKFIYCENETQFLKYLQSLKKQQNWNNIFSWEENLNFFLKKNSLQNNNENLQMGDSDAAISFCYSISAYEGVIILSPEQATNRRLVNFPKTHILIAYKNQLKTDVVDAVEGFEKKYDGRIASVLELHKNKPVSKEYHKILLKTDGPSDVYLFYIDINKID